MWNIKAISSLSARYCLKRPFLVKAKEKEYNLVLAGGTPHPIDRFLLVFCNWFFKKVSLMIGFTGFELGSFKAYFRLVCFLWRVMPRHAGGKWIVFWSCGSCFTYRFLCSSGKWGESKREKQTTMLIWCGFVGEGATHASFPHGLIFSGVFVSGEAGWGW